MREREVAEELVVRKIHTTLNLVDLLTKPVHPTPYGCLRKSHMNLGARSASFPSSRRKRDVSSQRRRLHA